MKFSVVALTLSIAFAGPALAAPGDPRLIQGALEWPPALSSGEPFLVVRGDDGRMYYADVMVAQRYVQGALSAGGHIALLGLESTKPHEIIAVALGSGDAAALSFAFAQATPTASLTAPSSPPTVPPGVPAPAPAGEPAAAASARLKDGQPSRGEEGRGGVTLRGSVYGVAGSNLFLKSDDGRVVVIDISKLDPSTARRLRPGSPVTVLAVPVGNKFQATGLVETETGTSRATPAKPADAR
jgi:hypothetical protein